MTSSDALWPFHCSATEKCTSYRGRPSLIPGSSFFSKTLPVNTAVDVRASSRTGGATHSHARRDWATKMAATTNDPASGRYVSYVRYSPLTASEEYAL